MIEVDLIKKHGKKALGMEEHTHRKLTWRQRLPEILLEIGIIVFAITLSIQLHSWHEHSLDREAERNFLKGMRQDLVQDLKELREDSLSYCAQLRGFRYYRTLTPQTLHSDSLKQHKWTLYNSTGLIPNNSRFEGLKASGKLGIIHDEKLLAAILDHYQEILPALLNETRLYNSNKQQNMISYLETHLDPQGRNVVAVMAQLPMQNYLNRDGLFSNIISSYHHVANHSRQLIRQIDKQLQ